MIGAQTLPAPVLPLSYVRLVGYLPYFKYLGSFFTSLANPIMPTYLAYLTYLTFLVLQMTMAERGVL